MKWHWLPDALLIFLALALEGHRRWGSASALNTFSNPSPQFWSSERKLAARERTKDLWYHGFDNYMKHAFPMDELTPLTCSGQGPDWANPRNIASNDVAGNFSLTLVDVLDTFVVLNDTEGFSRAVKNVIEKVTFSSDVKPQVFETTIRVLGGLLSGHQFATKQNSHFYLTWYQGELLDLAFDLGSRLLPAFNTPTGLPYARINLRHGLVKGETPETCAAGAGSLILEFATLSRLTGDPRFEKAARKAFFALWNRKSDIGLVGNTINSLTGTWTHPEVTGIGAGIDSFYEYALKWYIMSGESEFLDVWDDSYSAIMRYSRSTDGFWYKQINMRSGDTAYHTIDSLAAFWPGLQVLAGDIEAAIKLHLLYYNLWRKHSGLPEIFDSNVKIATSHQYPLRPEFVESTWYLYRATRDPFYLDVGERILFDITTRTKVDCGLAGVQDLRSNKLDDRMESFALSETLKARIRHFPQVVLADAVPQYLYLLFDEENPLHKDDSNYVFTTEGHLLTLDHSTKSLSSSSARRKKQTPSRHQCPAYDPSASLNWNDPPPSVILQAGIRSRSDYDYARELVGQTASDQDQHAWSIYGWCARPKVDIYAFDVVLSASGRVVPEDLSPSLLKIAPTDGGYIVHNITGIRTHIVRRLDGKGFDVRKMGHYSIRPGNLVYINDSSLFGVQDQDQTPQVVIRDPQVTLNFFMDSPDLMLQAPSNEGIVGDPSHPLAALQHTASAFTGGFGFDLTSEIPSPDLAFSNGEALQLHWEDGNTYGCDPFSSVPIEGVALVYRGECTFLEKLFHAQSAGAQGVVVISDQDELISPSANPDELLAMGDVSRSFIVVLPFSDGEKLVDMIEKGASAGLSRTFVSLVREPVAPSSTEKEEKQSPTKTADAKKDKPTQDRYLFLNGVPLINTRLLV